MVWCTQRNTRFRMATVTVKTKLDVIPKFTELMETSLNADSIYARNKETLEVLFQDSALKSNEKAEIISQILGAMAGSITSAAMTNAVQWATSEVELELKRLETEKQLDILAAEGGLRAAQAIKTQWESIAIQANTERSYGKPSTADGVLLSLAPAGKMYTETNLLAQQVTNAQEEENLIRSRLNESYAAIHKTVADTVVNYGPWTYSVGANGITSTSQGTAPVIPLSDVQRTIAKEQARGYAWNAWANAATASAGMLGTAIASDGAITRIDELVAIWESTVTKLKDARVATFPGDL